MRSGLGGDKPHRSLHNGLTGSGIWGGGKGRHLRRGRFELGNTKERVEEAKRSLSGYLGKREDLQKIRGFEGAKLVKSSRKVVAGNVLC